MSPGGQTRAVRRAVAPARLDDRKDGVGEERRPPRAVSGGHERGDLLARHAGEEGSLGEDIEEHYPEAVDVARAAVRARGHHLGRHVRDGADADGQPRVVVARRARAKVRQLCADGREQGAVEDKDVRGLHVAVDDAVPVEVLEPAEDVGHGLHLELVADLAEERVEAALRRELHDEVDALAEVDRAEELDDVRAPEGEQHLELARDLRRAAGRESINVLKTTSTIIRLMFCAPLARSWFSLPPPSRRT